MYSLCNLLGISDDFNIYKESIYYSNKLFTHALIALSHVKKKI